MSFILKKKSISFEFSEEVNAHEVMDNDNANNDKIVNSENDNNNADISKQLNSNKSFKSAESTFLPDENQNDSIQVKSDSELVKRRLF